jgi:hypothetical protein
MKLTFEDLEPEDCSICIDCAKHPSLKRFIERRSATGHACGVCLRDHRQIRYDVADLKCFTQLSYLIRALIRYYYDEHEYNPHWGGDLTPASILQGENPILFHEESADHHRDPAENECFFEHLFDPPYPPYDEGVAVYAGFNDGDRMMNWSLRRGRSHLFQTIGGRVQRENYFLIEPDLQGVFQDIGDRISCRIEEGATFHRARIGVSKRFARYDQSWDSKLKSMPYQAAELGAPPPPLAKAGRLNRAGVSFLYLASDADTAALEVRPHPGHEISIGRFRLTRPINIAKFDVEIDRFADSDAQLELFTFLVAANKAMSVPIVPEHADRYSLTQILAETARQRGFDGVEYSSALGGGRNLCIFDPTLFQYVERSAAVRRVASLQYRLEDVDTLHEPGPNDREIAR